MSDHPNLTFLTRQRHRPSVPPAPHGTASIGNVVMPSSRATHTQQRDWFTEGRSARAEGYCLQGQEAGNQEVLETHGRRWEMERKNITFSGEGKGSLFQSCSRPICSAEAHAKLTPECWQPLPSLCSCHSFSPPSSPALLPGPLLAPLHEMMKTHVDDHNFYNFQNPMRFTLLTLMHVGAIPS